MKTFAWILVALIMPFGCFIIAGMVGKRLLQAYRRRQMVPAS